MIKASDKDLNTGFFLYFCINKTVDRRFRIHQGQALRIASAGFYGFV
ncbi:hypothetical protein HMPREF1991_00712 [Hoylesella loescheii DSM 19665 = JCM 12249 = ATCC 15930]|uniref:Uncharacterized protein n=1 Tax=Hoylesella loescheii DSM 19665 = JCM 12249 = ATCC 15930 TaxID=1122985 RepID=A0A069QTK5_HOYLO|nr:hypothetical protein HMPREF1991_00712 [Hoylesella loescheii DSM 19665 = JCM 12249 = ATCC 15930]